MSIQIKIVGSSVRATDTSTGDIVFSEPSRDTWYKESRLKNGVIQMYDDNSPRQEIKNYPFIFLSDAVDENLTAFTEESFRLFVYGNLGFNPTVTIIVDLFTERVLNLSGGFVVENICYNG